jgi:hypothetical protein
MSTVATFMLLFSFSLTTADGNQLDEVVNVYSKKFNTQAKCERFLSNYGPIIRGKGIRSIQEMIKDEYQVKLNSVSCSQFHENG